MNMITEKELRRHHEIKYRLNLSVSSLAKIARSLELSPNTVHSVSSSRSKSMRVAQALADAIGEDVSILFPEYFQEKTKKTNMR